MSAIAVAVSVTVTVPGMPAQADHELEGRDLARGEAVYQRQCAVCHGAQLEGQPDWQVAGSDGILPAPPHDASGHTWHHDNALLFDYTRLGGREALLLHGITGFRSGMPAFGDVLDDGEIWDVIAFIRSTWPAEIQRIQAAQNPTHPDAESR